MTAEVLVVGSYNQDHVWRVDQFPAPGETRRGHAFQTGPGGKGFNQAVACHRQGAATLFFGALGKDALGEGAQRTAADFGVPCRWQLCDDAPTASTCILVDAAGRNEIVVYLAANERLDSTRLATAPEWSAARVLLVQMENNLDAIHAALKLAGENGLTRILNPAPVHADASTALLADCELLTPNETEFALLLAKLHGEHIAADRIAETDDASLHALCRKLGVPTVVITLGGAGCFVSHADGALRGDAEAHYRLPAERVEVIDTTGAGDAFNGALAAALLRFAGRPFRAMLVHAGRAAALSTERLGAATASVDFASVIARFGTP
ncbi:MAG TPA: ribokinase [Rhodanobacteraceae bacterium]|nr:ribokinase [Rhodanobacteraceae bacterium]